MEYKAIILTRIDMHTYEKGNTQKELNSQNPHPQSA